MKTAVELKEAITRHAFLAACYRSADVAEAEELNPKVLASIDALNAAVDEVYQEISRLRSDVEGFERRLAKGSP